MIDRALVFNISNALLFQLGWFICVLAGNVKAGSFFLVLLVFHFIYSSSRQLADVVAVFIALGLGLIHDLLLIHLGLIKFAESATFPPIWLSCLWGLLALTLNHSLLWIYSRPLWSSVLGAISAPLSYIAGVHLSSAEWSGSLGVVVPIISGLWLFILPVHRLICRRIEGYVQHKIHVR